MGSQRVKRPFAVVVIAAFQFVKAAFLLSVAGFMWLDPEALPHSQRFTEMLFIAAHGRDISGILVPVFGFYVAYVGVQLLRLRPFTRTNLAISSAVTIAVSLQRLGLFGESTMTSPFDRQTLYILILLDFTVYVYLAFHPEIARSFRANR